MSEYVFDVAGGETKRLLTAGKYCDRDIVINGTGGADASMENELLARSLTAYSNDRVTEIGTYAFYRYATLTSISCPALTTLKGSALQYCSGLTNVDFPAMTSLGGTSMADCTSLVSVVLPKVTVCYEYALARCTALKIVDFPSVQAIRANAFNGSKALIALILRRTDAVCTLSSTTAFTNTPIASGTGYTYVPRSLLSQYQADSVWSTCGAQFRVLEDYTVDGTTTGALDESKI